MKAVLTAILLAGMASPVLAHDTGKPHSHSEDAPLLSGDAKAAEEYFKKHHKDLNRDGKVTADDVLIEKQGFKETHD